MSESLFDRLIAEALKKGFSCHDTTIALNKDAINEIQSKALSYKLYFKAYAADVFMRHNNRKVDFPIYLLAFSKLPISVDDLPSGYISQSLKLQTSDYRNYVEYTGK